MNGATFQARVAPWLLACFGEMIAGDREERNHRFLEEALELVQACGCTEGEALQLVGYVYGRPVGDPSQEVGGVMVTLAALCLANGLDIDASAETELARIWTKVDAIRAKQAAKPKHSPLPQAVESDAENGMAAALAKAYADGAEEVHSYWKECRPDITFDREPDFTEASLDYGRHGAAAALATFREGGK